MHHNWPEQLLNTQLAIALCAALCCTVLDFAGRLAAALTLGVIGWQAFQSCSTDLGWSTVCSCDCCRSPADCHQPRHRQALGRVPPQVRDCHLHGGWLWDYQPRYYIRPGPLGEQALLIATCQVLW